MLEARAIAGSPRVVSPQRPQNANRRALPRQSGLDFVHYLLEQRQNVDFGKLKLTAPRISKKVGDNRIEAFRFSGHDLDEQALFIGQCGNAVQNVDRTSDRRQRVADFVRDSARKASDGGLLFANADFPFQAADLG